MFVQQMLSCEADGGSSIFHAPLVYNTATYPYKYNTIRCSEHGNRVRRGQSSASPTSGRLSYEESDHTAARLAVCSASC